MPSSLHLFELSMHRRWRMESVFCRFPETLLSALYFGFFGVSPVFSDVALLREPEKHVLLTQELLCFFGYVY